MNNINLNYYSLVDHLYFGGIKIEFNPAETAFNFKQSLTDSSFYQSSSKISKFFQRQLSALADYTLNSLIFNLATQGKIHVLAHELGHAVACKVLLKTKSTPRIVLYKNCSGETYLTNTYRQASDLKKSFIDGAGPLTNIVFSNIKLLFGLAFKQSLPKSLRLTLGVGSIFWITGEIYYAYCGVKNNVETDFGTIAMRNKKHLIIATSMLIMGSILGLLNSLKLIQK